MRRLVACLACRNQSSRLYGKPLQNLDVNQNITVLDYMIDAIKAYPCVSSIVLGISEGADNIVYKEIANKYGIEYIVSSEEDVLQRLILCCEKGQGTDIFRLTTESPFTCFEPIEQAWRDHVNKDYDITALDDLPDGSGFEIIKLSAYKTSWKNGDNKHKSEYCSLYIRENKEKFKFSYVDIPKELRRTDIRLTIDNPEDLILCRAIYKNFKHMSPKIPINEIIRFVDENERLKDLVEPFVADGLKTMYL